MRISDWSSDVCSSDLKADPDPPANVRINLRPRESGVVVFLVPEHGQAGDEVPPWPFPISNPDSQIPALSLRLVPLPPPSLPTSTTRPPPTTRSPTPPSPWCAQRAQAERRCGK